MPCYAMFFMRGATYIYARRADFSLSLSLYYPHCEDDPETRVEEYRLLEPRLQSVEDVERPPSYFILSVIDNKVWKS